MLACVCAGSVKKLCLPFLIFDLDITQQATLSGSLHTGTTLEPFQFEHILRNKTVDSLPFWRQQYHIAVLAHLFYMTAEISWIDETETTHQKFLPS